MRLISYQSATGPRIAAGRGGSYYDLQRADAGLPTSMKALLALGASGLARVAAALQRATEPLPASGWTLLAPVPDPEKVICIGLNYADHAKETGKEKPAEPVMFNKFPTAVSAAGQPIVLPRVSQEVDFEAELVAVIGREGRHIAREQALEYVAGYCCGHDVSARDWQIRKPGGQWLLGKSFDGFAPFGPELVTADEAGDVSNLRIQFRLNGQTMQDSSTAQLIFPVAELVAYVSQVCTLKPGDVIFTGTPSGVGAARKPPVFMKAGDTAEVEIAGLGVLRNPVAAE